MDLTVEWTMEFCVRQKAPFYTKYRRDWLIGACAYRLQQQENMRLLYVYVD